MSTHRIVSCLKFPPPLKCFVLITMTTYYTKQFSNPLKNILFLAGFLAGFLVWKDEKSIIIQKIEGREPPERCKIYLYILYYIYQKKKKMKKKKRINLFMSGK